MPQPTQPGANQPPTQNKNWYAIRAKSEDTVEVLIYGDIGDFWYGESVTAQEFVKELQALTDKNLVVRINSYGGAVADGVAIYNAIKRHPKAKTTHIDGVAMSIASLIAMAGDTVHMAENAIFMVHAPMTGTFGNASFHLKQADMLKKYAEAMTTSYVAKTGKNAEEIRALLDDGEDHFYSAQEAKEAGFVDEITGATQDEESARYLQAALARFKVPAAVAARWPSALAEVAAALSPRFALGDRIKIKNPHDPEHEAGEIVLVSAEPVYGVAIDGMESMGMHRWYTDSELESDDASDSSMQMSHQKIPAAAAARFAAVAAQFTPEEDVMPEPTKPAATTAPDNVIQIEEAAVAKEQARIAARNTEITAMFNRFMDRDGVAALHSACIADPKLTTEQANAKLLAKLGEGSEPLAPTASGRAIAGEDARDKQRVAMVGSLAARMGVEKADAANPYRGMRLHELARACLAASGVKVDGLSMLDLASMAVSRQAVRGAQTTSDFPVILENTLHKLVLTGYQAQTATWQRFCKVGSVSDFRAWNRLVPGLLGNLDTVNEHGEYKNKNIPDALKNSVQATRKGNIINITPEVIVNDDTGYVMSIAQGLGALGQRAVERAVYTLLNANPTLSDGVALFHATHNNLAGAGAVPSVDTLDAGRQAMASQTAPGDDAEYLDIQPAIAVVTLAQGGNTRVIVNAVYDPDTANKLQKPNKVNGMVKDVVDSPRLTGTAWYLFADPNVAPVIEVVFLDGQQTPVVTEEVNFRTSGLAYKVELPFGVGAIGYHGGYKNPGA